MGGPVALELACRCGGVQAELSPGAVAAATHLKCYCKDCQAAARFLAYALPENGGTELIHTTPDGLRIRLGGDRLAAFRLGPKGNCRWYAECCNTPMFVTLPRRTLPFLGIVVEQGASDRAAAALGPIWGHAFTASAISTKDRPAKDRHMMGIGARIMMRMAGAFLSGKAGLNPFLTEASDWIVTPYVLTKDERRSATP